MQVDIYINKTVEQNAELYYEKAKKARKKLKGALETIEKFSRESAELENIKIEHAPSLQRKRFWFEKFRWFITSTGFLVIGGRDATTNEIVIKKHTEPNDIVFHTDMAGSPFFIIKSENKDIHDQTLKEVADATCSFSRAWKLGMNTQSVFYVSPEQVTKEAKAGEYLAKGAFMIKGKTNYIDNKVNLAIGRIAEGEYSGLVMCAPLESVTANCQPFFQLKQGNTKPSDIAKKLRKELDSPIDDVIRALPSGNSELVKERKRK
jgi:predicted ribosome quality control (RQC) complex YloA/Tae2 family protein